MNAGEVYNGASGGCKQFLDRVAEVYEEIRSLANKYVFLEENDIRGWNMGSWIINHTGDCWIDPLAGWHNDRGTLGFADGHAEYWKCEDGRVIEWGLEMRSFSSQPSNPDTT